MKNRILKAKVIALLGTLAGCSTVTSRPIDLREEEREMPVAIESEASDTDELEPGSDAATSNPSNAAPSASTVTPKPAVSTKVKVTRFDPANRDAASQAGIAYFLPRQLATVTVKKTETTFDDAIGALGKAELALSIAQAQAAAAKSSLSGSQDQLIDKGDNPVIRDLLVSRIAEQGKAVTKADAGAAKAEKDRDAKRDALKSKPDAGADKLFKVTIDIALMAPVPDLNHGYRLNPRHSAFRDDKHKFEVTRGLLSSSDITAADRTGDILVELATFAGAATSLSMRSSNGRACTDQGEVSVVVDLADLAAVNQLNDIIHCLGVELEPDGAMGVGRPLMSKNVRASANGIFYRTPVDLLFKIRRCNFGKNGICPSGNWPIAQIISVSLPQAGPISYVPQNAGPFTTTHYGLAFKDGMLATYDSTRPSELLEVARTPMRMVNGFFAGVSKVVSIRTGQNNEQATLVQSETALQTAQLNSQTTVSAAELAASQALLRDQAKRDAMNRCIGERVTRGEPYDSCFAGS